MTDTITPQNQVMRPRLRELLHNASVDLPALNSFSRILLTTDGTLTEILEAYFLERIQLIKLAEATHAAEYAVPALNVQVGDEIIERKIALQGATSGINFVYAESIIVVNELDDSMKDGLLRSKTPIGRLWLEHKMETFKEMMYINREEAGAIAPLFEIAVDAPILSRAYRVFTRRKPVIMITEKFPDRFPNAYA